MHLLGVYDSRLLLLGMPLKIPEDESLGRAFSDLKHVSRRKTDM